MTRYLLRGQRAVIVNNLFQTLLICYLLLLLIEQIFEGFVSFYLNLNYLLIVLIIVGIIDVFSEHEEKKKEVMKPRDYVFIALLGILGFSILKYKTADLGLLSWVISSIAGILIILLSLLVLEEDESL